MKVIYLAGPYRGDSEWAVWQNIQRASEVAVELWQAGFAVVCPHRNSMMMGGAIPDDALLAGDMEIMKRCDMVVLAPGWETSAGALAERLKALQWRLPVYRWDMCRDELLAMGRDEAMA